MDVNAVEHWMKLQLYLRGAKFWMKIMNKISFKKYLPSCYGTTQDQRVNSKQGIIICLTKKQSAQCGYLYHRPVPLPILIIAKSLTVTFWWAAAKSITKIWIFNINQIVKSNTENVKTKIVK